MIPKDLKTGIQLEQEPEATQATVQDELTAYCMDLYQECKGSAYRKEKLAQREQNRKRYAGDMDDKSEPWEGCSNKSLMIDAIVIDNLEPRLMAQLFGDKDFLDVQPVGPEDAQHVPVAQDTISWLLTENMRIETQLKPVIHDLLLDGTQVVIPMWQEDTRQTMIREPIPEFVSQTGDPLDIPPEQARTPAVQQLLQQGLIRFSGIGERINFRETNKWMVKIEQIPLPDCYFPDDGGAWDEMPFMRMIYPLYYELEELSEENGGPYKNITTDLIIGQSRSDEEQHDTDMDRTSARHSEYSEECPLLECHIPFKGEWQLVTFSIHNGWKEVRRQPMTEVYAHGRKAPHRFDVFRESNESMGMGIPWKIRHSSGGCNDLYNQMIDSGTLKNTPYGYIEEGPGIYAMFDGVNDKIKPGKHVVIPKNSKIIYPNFNVNPDSFLRYIELLMQMQERLISLMNYSSSGQVNQGSAGSETYAGMSLLVNEGNIRHQYTGRGLRDETSELVKDILSLYGQYLPFDAKRRIFENDQYTFEPFDMEALQGQYDITIGVSSSSGNKMLKRQEANEMLTATGGNPLVNLPKILEDYFESYDKKNVKDYIKPEVAQVVSAVIQDPGVLQVVQQYMQQKQEQARIQQIHGQAQANIERQQIERQAEAPLENQKIVDQTTESAKRQLIKPMIEQQVQSAALAGAI